MSARRRRRRFAGAAAAACLGLATAAAGETSRISAEAATAYQLLEIRDPEAVPADFTGGGPAHYCATPLAVAAVEALEGADPFAGRLLARALQRPSLAHHAVSPSGHFRVHYDTEGPDAVGTADADGNGVPDYVDLAMTLADSAWHVQVEVLGYQEPPADGGFGGGDEIDIYLTDVGRSRRYGLTYPMSGGDSGPSYLEIDNDFENPVFGTADGVCSGYSGSRGHDALRVTLAHEFFHAVQFGYYQGYDGAWWQEASATWMEDVLHPGVNDYLQYVCIFLESPKSALDSGDPRVDLHAYGSSIFAFFLDQRYGRETIRFTWEEHARRRAVSLDNFDRALRDFHGEAGESGPEAGLDRAFSDFAVWSWFVGDRHRDEFFTEGDRYPSREEPAFPVSAGAAAADSGAIDHMASRYVRLDPRLLPGGATLRIDQPGGRWRNRLLLASPDSLEERDLRADGLVTVRGWDAWDEVVLVLSNVDRTGIGYDYGVVVEYDPGLVDEVGPPTAASLDPVWPNPFRPAGHGAARIPFALHRPSAAGSLTLYAADGRRVRQFDLGARSARRHLVSWDGTNESGEPVGSGIYYAVLEAEGVSLRRPLAVVRDR